MNRLYGIILTIISGLFFLIGGIITHKCKNKDKLNHFSVALAFMVMLGLIVLDLFPEVMELMEDYKIIEAVAFIGVFACLGFIILKVLDLFIPDHHHEHKDNEKNKKEHISHIHHIGILTIISLILHNLLEGFMIFGMALNDFKVGILMTISIALHNIPLGTHIFSSIDLKDNKLLVGSLTLSSLVGGLLFLVVGNVSNIILALVTALTLGMIIYILLLELLPEVVNNRSKKETILGLLLGIIIIGIAVFI